MLSSVYIGMAIVAYRGEVPDFERCINLALFFAIAAAVIEGLREWPNAL
jgi:hypothetical protein